MRLAFLGTGGATTTPRPTCHCPVCDEARAKGLPYTRTGPSLFVHGPDLLFDTPEEIKFQLNRAGIDRIGACFYSHWHPDHTLGRRVFESLFMGKFRHRWQSLPDAPVPIYLAPQVARDFARFMALAEHFDYMSERGWTSVRQLAEGETVRFGDVSVRAVPLADPSVYAFLLEARGRRVLIAMDELVGWQPPDWLRGVDVAVLPMGIVEFDPFGSERWIPADHPILRVEATFTQTMDMARALAPKQLYFAHIEEADGLSYDDLLRLQGQLRETGLPATFAYDGLQVDVV
jgi:phosphoribosyl 1,2-cyclic phosphate phosphodiesterase